MKAELINMLIMTLLRKIHKITTYIAVFSALFASAFLFLFIVTETFRIDIIGRGFELLFLGVAALGGILFGLTAVISVLLSLYLISQKN